MAFQIGDIVVHRAAMAMNSIRPEFCPVPHIIIEIIEITTAEGKETEYKVAGVYENSFCVETEIVLLDEIKDDIRHPGV